MNILYCIRYNAPRTTSKASTGVKSVIGKRTAAHQISALRSPQENEVFTLADGQKIGYSTYGPLNAPALFFFHGQGSSRLQNLTEPANVTRLRIICPDRPGIGLSTFVPGRRLLDYPAQIAQLASHLGLESYHVAGGSGGGPYALACAYTLPRNQLKGAAVVAGVGPPEDSTFSQMRLGTRLLFAGFRYAPSLVGAGTDLLIGRKARRSNPEILRKEIKHQMKYLKAITAPGERELFEKPKFIDELIEDLQEQFRQGPKGFVGDGQILVESWGFKLEDVSFPNIRLYYGSKDINTPPQMGMSMATKLKGSVYKEYENETHMTLFEKHGIEILRDIAEQ